MTRRGPDEFRAELDARKQGEQAAALQVLDTEHLPEHLLSEHAKEDRRLRKRVIEDVVKIGRRLTQAKELAGHGCWLPWLDHEFGSTQGAGGPGWSPR